MSISQCLRRLRDSLGVDNMLCQYGTGWREDGTTTGWDDDRMGRRQDGTTTGWDDDRMGRRQDGTTTGWDDDRKRRRQQGVNQQQNDSHKRSLSAVLGKVAQPAGAPPNSARIASTAAMI